MNRFMGPVDAVGAALFRSLSSLRRKRIFHPHGVAFRVRVQAHPSTPVSARPLFEGDGARDGVVRLSRGAGLPEPLPDILGVALKFDRQGSLPEQDLLLASSGEGPVLQNLLIPARRFGSRPFSTVLFYRSPGGLVLFGAFASGRDASLSLAEIFERTELDLTLLLATASPFGSWRPFATAALTERLADTEAENLRFDPANTANELEPAGALNRLRAPVYEASQEGRGVAKPKLRAVGGLDEPAPPSLHRVNSRA